ncbi:hypothetical protein EP7_005374 [Isosphaeraceae bacterium EP7]
MDTKIWWTTFHRWGWILLLRGNELHLLEMTGPQHLRALNRAVENLTEGEEPAYVGAKSVKTIRLGSILGAVVDPDDFSLTLRTEGGRPRTLEFTPGAGAGEIVRAILSRTGRAYHEERREIGLRTALLGPTIGAVVSTAVCILLHPRVMTLAAGLQIEPIRVMGGRDRGGQVLADLFNLCARVLGVKGFYLLVAALLVLNLRWAVRAATNRPMLTAWEVERA